MNIQTLKIRRHLYSLNQPLIMGILNITPDSFYDGKQYETPETILKQVKKMVTEGVDIIDIGGCSSRPGAADVTEKEELRRVIFALKLVKRKLSGLTYFY